MMSKRIIALLVHENVRQAALEDFEDRFQAMAHNTNRIRAYLWLWVQILCLIPGFLKDSLDQGAAMFKSFFKIAFRHMRKHKSYSFINILGFTVSLALTFLIIQILNDFFSYDRFQEKKDRIYRVTTLRSSEDGERTFGSTPYPLATALEEQCPGIERVVRLQSGIPGNARYENKLLPIAVMATSSSFFEVFDFRLETGDPQEALKEPFSMVLTQDMALSMFGDEEPLGKVIRYGELGDYTVTGVLEDASKLKSHIEIRPMISFSSLESLVRQKKSGIQLDSWENLNYNFVYVLLEEKASSALVEDFFPGQIQAHLSDKEYSYKFRLQALTKINPGTPAVQNPGSTMPWWPITLLSITAVLIMLTAAFNYTNLSIARALTRAREVGIRKVVGAKRFQLVLQFTGEAVSLTLIAFVFAILLYKGWLEPAFLGLHYEFSRFFLIQDSPRFYVFVLLFTLATGIVAGLFPAVYMSRFRPVQSLRGGGSHLFKKIKMRKALIVMQFAISLIFIISTVVFYRQQSHMQGTDPGYRTDNILNVRVSGLDYEYLRNKLVQSPHILGVSACDNPPGTSSFPQLAVKRVETEDDFYLRRILVDGSFIANLGIEIVAGEDFPPTVSNESRFCLINETAVKRLDLQSPAEAVGRELIRRDGSSLHIIGVVGDFYLNRLTDAVEPCYLLGRASGFRYLNLRYRPGSEGQAVAFLEETWQEIPVAPLLSYTSYKYQIQDELSSVSVSATVFRFVGGLALLVACLGLLGIANYSARVKIKEIGIRKVLGADTAGLVRLLSKDFTRLLLIATAIAMPIAYYVNSLFTQSFSNRAGLRIEYFLFAALLMVGFGLAAVLSQTIRASLANPVDSLKHEE